MECAHYSSLLVWQKAMTLVDAVYDLARDLPSDEKYALSDQMRRAAVSVPSNIAEGYGRHTEKEFKRFLSFARGSVFELETQIAICLRRQFFSEEKVKHVLSLCGEIGKMLTALSKH